MVRKKAPKTNPAIVYLRNVGGGLSVLGLIGIVPFPQFYWYGVVTFCIGLAALALEALLENWPITYRVLVCGWWVAVGVLFFIKFVCVSAPLDMSITVHNGDYSDGANIYGIRWEPGMSELRIVLANHTSNDYDDVDIAVVPDVPTRAMAQVTSVPDVSLSLSQTLAGADFAGVEGIARDQNGKVISGDSPTGMYASGAGFRMRCPKIPKHTTIDLLVALVNPTAMPPNGTSTTRATIIWLYGNDVREFAGPKKLASGLHIKGQYTVLNRPHLFESNYAVK